MIEKSKIYHSVPDNIEGELLMPLNELRVPYPETYREHAKKYEGREEVMLERIPYFNCLWNDVLQFSPVHPEKVRENFIKLGFKWEPCRWFEVDVVEAGFNVENAVIYMHPIKEKGDFRNLPEEFEKFSLSKLSELAEVPQRSINMWALMKKEGQRPFTFIGIPHVLYKGALEISKLDVIEV